MEELKKKIQEEHLKKGLREMVVLGIDVFGS